MTAFKAENGLEQTLLDAQEGRVPVPQFFESLCSSQVFVLINKEIAPSGTWDNETSILVLNSQSGIPVIAMFTSPGRSVGWPEQAKEYRFGLQVEFRWLLKGVADGVGIVINPSSEVGVEISPSTVQKLKQTIGPQ